MKKYLLFIALSVGWTVSVFSYGLDFHIGAGYSGSVMGELPKDVDDVFKDIPSRPIGLGGYVGLGFGLGKANTLNLGIEFAPRWEISLQDPYFSGFSYQGRAYLKIKPLEIFTLTPFIGLGGDLIFGAQEESFNQLVYIAGTRVTLFFLYFEYATQIQKDFSAIMSHQIGFGFAFSR